MELLNASKMVAGYTLGVDKDARESLIVVAKATFTIPIDGSEPSMAEEQLPLVDADQFTGPPGLSAATYESDFAPVKPRCDVLLLGSAYSPGRQPRNHLEVGLRASSVVKKFRVLGDRNWAGRSIGFGTTNPEPFERKSITYDVAFGGVDDFHEDEEKRDAYLPNPVGRGFHRNLDTELVHNTPLPNTEEIGTPIRNPDGKYNPMAFGPVGRGWPVRARYAGTYDDNWVDNVFPFLPEDFDNRYYQAAPEDQQCSYLRGGEVVSILNLSPIPRLDFRIPDTSLPVVYFRRRGRHEIKQANADTLILEPDEWKFSIVWRSSILLQRDIFEISDVLVGDMPRAWWRAREVGKAYYSSIAEMIKHSQEENE